MDNYFISFRIASKTAGGKTYDQRREALVEAVHSDSGFWDGTTSFLAVSSPLNTGAFAKQAASALSRDDDMLIVFDPADMSMAYFGQVEHADVLESFFGSSTKI
ncbi:MULTISPECIES: hypothetical protein [Rhizobium]|uniref:hypothetical protein n=1 Tax=Rhizobium TaxID=379 RepID=UPI000411E70F|nr:MULTISPECIES: hypothetical protein [Rhizobium]MCS0463778.1 hypothetical protein [Rhizobium favelukesii]UFS84672.1 hypothetical protein LPB79_32915 [Rhizobium sp. T136]